MKQHQFPAVASACTLISSQSNPVSYLTAKSIATILPNYTADQPNTL
jgi:hypothetical protein